jgi:hypothetical protein
MKLTAEQFLAVEDPTSLTRRRLGAGMFGSVWTTDDPDKVIKRGTNMSDGWPYYALWTMQADRGPAALKVYALRVDDKGYWALTERADMVAADYGLQRVTARRDYRELRSKIIDHFEPEFGIDLHDHNIMVRKDGSTVITDPLAASRDSAFGYDRNGEHTHARLMTQVAGSGVPTARLTSQTPRATQPPKQALWNPEKQIWQDQDGNRIGYGTLRRMGQIPPPVFGVMALRNPLQLFDLL